VRLARSDERETIHSTERTVAQKAPGPIRKLFIKQNLTDLAERAQTTQLDVMQGWYSSDFDSETWDAIVMVESALVYARDVAKRKLREMGE
jgi:hypothetical protein